MKQQAVFGLSVVVLGSACVHYGGPSLTQNQSILSASVNVTAVPPRRLVNVPDIPSVPGARVDADTIHATLDDFGQWREDPAYGLVWTPSSEAVGGAPFVPYGTNGRWTLTDAGWYWQSGYQFGWLTFHYGRWVTVEGQWAWVPGAMFAPAWVDWRAGGAYVGWAPLPPRGASFSAPYAYCSYDALAEARLWDRVVYGPAAAVYYSSTRSLAASYGIGGAVYAWGPTGGSAGVATAVPVATAWGGETSGPRAGTPLSIPASTPRTGAPASGSAGIVSGRPAGNGSPRANDSDTASAAPVDPAAAPPDASRVAPPYRTDVAVRPYPIANGGRYGRLPQTVVIPGAISSQRIRETVSLGTTEPYVPAGRVPSFAPSYTGSTPSAGAGVPSYAAPPSYQPYTPPPSMPPGYTSSVPTSVPSYAAPSFTPSAAPPAYGSPAFRPAYTSPGSVPTPAYVPTSAPTSRGVSAPPAAVFNAPPANYVTPSAGARPVGGGIPNGGVFRR